MDERGIDSPSEKEKLDNRANKYIEKHNVSLEEALDRYLNSRTTVNRRVDNALEACGWDTSKTNPHGLRATATSFHAGADLSTLSLQAKFGWKQIGTAMKYISKSGVNTQRELNSIH